MCHVKWYEVWAYRLRSPNGGGGDRPRPFIIIAIWAQALCWPRSAEIPLQGLVSAVALVLCIHTGVSELLAHDEWGGLLSCLERHSLRHAREERRGLWQAASVHYHRDLGAGFVLPENRGNTVTRARVSSSIGIMHPYWGL